MLIVTAKRRIKGAYTKWLIKTKQGLRKKEAVELPAKRENVYATQKKPPESGGCNGPILRDTSA